MELFKTFPLYYCTQYFMIFSCLLCLYTSFSRKTKYTELRRLHFYPLLSCVEIIFNKVIYKLNLKIHFEDGVNQALIHLFTVFEVLLIYDFYSHILKGRRIKTIMSFLLAIFFIFITIYWILPKDFFIPAFDIFFGEAVCILIPSFYYYVELFEYPLVGDLNNESSFWVTTGILFYFSTTLPLFSFKDLILGIGSLTEPEVYSINFICYSILFLIITKAYLCKPREVQL